MTMRCVLLIGVLALSGNLAVTGAFRRGCAPLQECAQVLSAFDATQGLPLTSLTGSTTSAEDILDAVCSLHSTTNNCINRNIGSCRHPQILAIVRNSMMIFDHVCDPDNREDMIQVFRSPCLRDKSMEQMVMSGIQVCLMAFKIRAAALAQRQRETLSVNFEDYCPLIHDVGACAVNSSVEVCGEHVGRLTEFIWELALNNMLPRELSVCLEEEEEGEGDVEIFARRSLDFLFGGTVPAARTKRHISKKFDNQLSLGTLTLNQYIESFTRK